jgi:hypothetical protein
MTASPIRPPRLVRLQSSGATVFLHPCSVCGKPAAFGVGFSGKLRKLGVWYCLTHRPAAKQGALL